MMLRIARGSEEYARSTGKGQVASGQNDWAVGSGLIGAPDHLEGQGVDDMIEASGRKF
jgi:hypothetical protein